MTGFTITFPWIVACAITACLVGALAGYWRSQRRQLPVWLILLVAIWMVLWCFLLAGAVAVDTENRRWRYGVGGIVFMAVAMSHAVCFMLGRSSAGRPLRSSNSRATITKSPDFDALADRFESDE